MRHRSRAGLRSGAACGRRLGGRRTQRWSASPLLAHAKDCPDCRETVKLWGAGAVGLVAFLHFAPLPVAIAAPPFAAAFGGAVAGSIAAGSAGAGAAGGSGADAAGTVGCGRAAQRGGRWKVGGTAAAGSAGVAGLSTGAALTVGGVIKASLIALAAGAMVATGGVAVQHLASAHHHGATQKATAPATHSHGGKTLPTAAARARKVGQTKPGGLQGRGLAAGHAKTPAGQSATHTQRSHAAGSAAATHAHHVAPKPNGHVGQTKTKQPHAKHTPGTNQKPATTKQKSAKAKGSGRAT